MQRLITLALETQTPEFSYEIMEDKKTVHEAEVGDIERVLGIEDQHEYPLRLKSMYEEQIRKLKTLATSIATEVEMTRGWFDQLKSAVFKTSKSENEKFKALYQTLEFELANMKEKRWRKSVVDTEGEKESGQSREMMAKIAILESEVRIKDSRISSLILAEEQIAKLEFEKQNYQSEVLLLRMQLSKQSNSVVLKKTQVVEQTTIIEQTTTGEQWKHLRTQNLLLSQLNEAVVDVKRYRSKCEAQEFELIELRQSERFLALKSDEMVKLKELLDDRNSQIETLNKKMEANIKMNERLNRKLVELRENNEQLIAASSLSSEKNKKLKAHIDYLEGIYEEAKSKNEALIRRLSEGESQTSSRVEVLTVADNDSRVKSQFENTMQQITKLKAELSEVAKEKQEIEKRLREETNMKMQRDQTILQLETDLKVLMIKLEEALRNNKTLTTENSQLKVIEAEKEKAIDSWERKSLQLESDIDSLKERLFECQKRETDTKFELERVERQNQKLNDEVALISATFKLSKERMDKNLQDENESLKNGIQKMNEVQLSDTDSSELVSKLHIEIERLKTESVNLKEQMRNQINMETTGKIEAMNAKLKLDELENINAHMLERIEELVLENSSLGIEKQKTDFEIASQLRELKNEREVRTELDSALRTLKSVVASKESANEQLSEKIKSAEENLKRTKSEMEKQTNDTLKSIKSMADELSSVRESTSEQIKSLHSHVNQLKRENAALKSEDATSKRQIAILKVDIENKERQINEDLKNMHSVFDLEINQMQEKMRASDFENLTLKTDKKRLIEMMSRVHQSEQDESSEVNSLRQALEQITLKNSVLTKKMEDNAKQVANLINEYEQNTGVKENSQLKVSLMTAESECDELRRQLELMNFKLKEKNAKTEEKKCNVVIENMEAISELKNEIDLKNTQLSGLKRLNDDLENQIENLNMQLTELTSNCTQYTSNETLKAEIADYVRTIDELKRQVVEFTESALNETSNLAKLNGELEVSRFENELLRRKMELLETELTMRRKQALESIDNFELSQLTQDIAKIQHENKSIRWEIELHVKTAIDRESFIESLLERIRRMEEDPIRTLRAQVSESNIKINSLNTENQMQRRKIELIENELNGKHFNVRLHNDDNEHTFQPNTEKKIKNADMNDMNEEELTFECEQLNSENTLLREKISELQKELESKNDDNGTEKSETINALQNELIFVKEELTRVASQLDKEEKSSREVIKSLKMSQTTVNQRNEDLEKELIESGHRSDKLKREIVILDSELKAMKLLHEKNTKTIDELIEKIGNEEEAMQNNKEQSNPLNDDDEIVQVKKEESQRQLDMNESFIKELQAKITEHLGVTIEQGNKIIDLEKKIAKLQTEKNKAEIELIAVKDNKIEEQMEIEIKELRVKLSELSTKCSDLERQETILVYRVQEFENIEKDNKELEEVNASLLSRLAEYSKKASKQSERNEAIIELEKENEELEIKLAEMKERWLKSDMDVENLKRSNLDKERVEDELQLCRIECKSLQEWLNKCDSESETQKNTIFDLKRQLVETESAKANSESLEQQLKIMTASQVKAFQSLESATTRANNAELELLECRNEMSTKNKVTRELSDSLNNAIANSSELLEKINAMSKETTETKIENARLMNELESSKETVSELVLKLKSVEEKWKKSQTSQIENAVASDIEKTRTEVETSRLKMSSNFKSINVNTIGEELINQMNETSQKLLAIQSESEQDKRELDELRREVKEKSQAMQVSEAKVIELKGQLQEQSRRLIEGQNQISDASLNIESLQLRLKLVEAELRESTNQVSIEEQCRIYFEELMKSRLEKQVDEQSSQKKIESLESDIAELEFKLEAKTIENTTETNSKLNEMKLLLEESESKIKLLESEIEFKSRMIESLSEAVQISEKTIKTEDGQVTKEFESEMKTQLNERNEVILKMSGDLERLTLELSLATDSCRIMSEQLEKLEKEKMRTNQINESIKSAAVQAVQREEKIKETTEQIDYLKIEIEKLAHVQRDNIMLSTENELNAKSCVTLKNQVKQLSATIEQLAEKLETSNRIIQEGEFKVNLLNVELENCNKKLQMLDNRQTESYANDNVFTQSITSFGNVNFEINRSEIKSKFADEQTKNDLTEIMERTRIQEEKLKRKTVKLNESREKVKQMIKERMELEYELERAKDKLTHLQTELKSKSTIDDLQLKGALEVDKMKWQIERLEEEKSDLEYRLKASEEHPKERKLREELVELKVETELLRSQVEFNAQSENLIKHQMEMSERNNVQMREQLELKNEAIKQIMIESNALKIENATLSMKLTASESKAKELKLIQIELTSEINRLETELMSNKNTLDELQKMSEAEASKQNQIIPSKDEDNSMSEKIERLKSEIKILKHESADKTNSNSLLLEEIEIESQRVKQELREKNEVENELRAENSRLKNEINLIQFKLSSLQAEVKAKTNQLLGEHSLEDSQLSLNFDASLKMNVDATNEWNSMQMEVQSLKRVIDTQNEELSDKEVQLAALKLKINILSSELSDCSMKAVESVEFEKMRELVVQLQSELLARQNEWSDKMRSSASYELQINMAKEQIANLIGNKEILERELQAKSNDIIQLRSEMQLAEQKILSNQFSQ